MTGPGRSGEVRWGILGAAGIAASAFLPALREAGTGRAALVGGRDVERARHWAADHGVDRAVAGYDEVVDSPDIDAVYVALPNASHAAWTQRALRAGKAVLCEKPLCVDAAETTAVLATAGETGSWLWEAFVFPFSAQQRRLEQLIGAGAIGAVREVQSTFHFVLDRPGDIRMSAELGGGALADLGCYPVRFAHEIFPASSRPVVAGAGTMEGSVETEAWGLVSYDPGRLLLSCGFRLARDTTTRVLGTSGQVLLSSPFHPRPPETITVLRPGLEPIAEHPTSDEYSFTAALRHIHRVLRQEEEPQHLAVEVGLRPAEVLDALRAAARS